MRASSLLSANEVNAQARRGMFPSQRAATVAKHYECVAAVETASARRKQR